MSAALQGGVAVSRYVHKNVRVVYLNYKLLNTIDLLAIYASWYGLVQYGMVWYVSLCYGRLCCVVRVVFVLCLCYVVLCCVNHYSTIDSYILVCVQGGSAISPVQKLCLLKLVRPDCLVPAIQQYVINSLGPHFAQPGPVSLHSVKKDSNNTTPIIFILSPGKPQPHPTVRLVAFPHCTSQQK